MNKSTIYFLFIITGIFATAIAYSNAISDNNAYGSSEKKYNDREYYGEKEYRDYDRDYGYEHDKDGKYGNVFVTKMTGEDQIPPNDSPAFGFAKVTSEKNPVTSDKELWYKVSLFDVPRGDDITQIHIHKITNPDGTGPHIVTLCGFIPELGFAPISCPEGPGVVAAGALTDENIEPNTAGIETLQQLFKAMKAGETYVNVHSTDFGGEGEIRGVLVPKY